MKKKWKNIKKIWALQGGFTLLEMVVTLALIATILPSLIGILSIGHQMIFKSLDDLDAIEVQKKNIHIQQILEEEFQKSMYKNTDIDITTSGILKFLDTKIEYEHKEAGILVKKIEETGIETTIVSSVWNMNFTKMPGANPKYVQIVYDTAPTNGQEMRILIPLKTIQWHYEKKYPEAD